MPHHRALDRVVERYLGSARIGTTGRGIGPAYGDKVGRVGIRVQDLLDPGILRQKLELVLREKNQILVKVYNRKAIDVDAVTEEYLGYAERLKPYIADTRLALARRLGGGQDGPAGGRAGHAARRRPRHVPVRHLVQPDRGWCLRRLRHPADADHPGHRHHQGVHDPGRRRAVPDRAVRRERRSTCSRSARSTAPRPAGNGAAVGSMRWSRRYAVRVNGITDLVVTKLDVLSGLAKVPICVGYEVDGVRYDEHADDADRVPPRHADLRGDGRLVGGHLQGREPEDLPDNARRYVERIEELSGARVSVVGVGPGRDENVIRHELI